MPDVTWKKDILKELDNIRSWVEKIGTLDQVLELLTHEDWTILAKESEIDVSLEPDAEGNAVIDVLLWWTDDGRRTFPLEALAADFRDSYEIDKERAEAFALSLEKAAAEVRKVRVLPPTEDER